MLTQRFGRGMALRFGLILAFTSLSAVGFLFPPPAANAARPSLAGNPPSATSALFPSLAQTGGLVSFSSAIYDVSESATTTTITLVRTSTSGTRSVILGVTDGTASAGYDYFPPFEEDLVITFPNGVASVNFTLNLYPDTFVEGNETVLLGLTGLGIGTPSTATLTIIDDDQSAGQVQLAQGTLSVNEAVGNAQLTVNRTGGTSAFTVNYAITAGTASSGSDYTGTGGTVSFAANETSKTISIPIVNDTAVESNETFTVALNGPTGGATLGAPSSATVTITDNDTQLAWQTSSVTVGEGAGTASLTVTRAGVTTGAVGVSYATANGTATAGSDYAAASGTLSFASGETSKTVTVTILNDASGEANETLTVTLSGPTGGATLGTSTATVTITDDDGGIPGQFQFQQGTVSVGEAAGTLNLTVTRAGGSSGAVSVPYTFTDGTASNGSDFAATNGSVSFAGGETSKSISVTITNDTLVESSETFTVTLGAPSAGSLGSPSTATVTITDNDTRIDLAQAAWTVDEGVGNAVLTVTRAGVTTGPTDVDFGTTNGTALAGSDFTAPAAGSKLTFAAGETSKTISIPITDDPTAETTESFTITLSNPTGGATLGTSSATVSITDNDGLGAPKLAFSRATYAGREGEVARIGLTVARTGSTTGNASVTYATTDGTAQAPHDYQAATGTLTFDPGESTKSIDVYIYTDAGPEPNETFTVTLSNPSGASLGPQSSTTVTIQDASASPSTGTLRFSATNFAASETVGFVTVGIARTDGAQGIVTATISTSSGTATAGSDYTHVPSAVFNFGPGDSETKYMTLQIAFDTATEGDETFTLTLSRNGTPGDTATVVIADDGGVPQPGFLKMESPTRFAVEGGGTAQVTILRTGGSLGSVGVRLTTTNGTAQAPGDYTTKDEVVTLADGETSKTVNIALANDGAYEPDETFTATLSNPTGGASLLPARTTTVTVTDDDPIPAPVLKFGKSAYAFREGEGNLVTLSVVRIGDSRSTVSVDFRTADGTAVSAGGTGDYIAQSGKLAFAPGEVEKTVSVFINTDPSTESNETFSVILENPNRATLGTPATATVTIRDAGSSQSPGVAGLSVATVAASETLGSVMIGVARTDGAWGPLTVNYATSDGSAVAGQDYVAVSGTTGFGHGDMAVKFITIQIKPDTLAEGNETFKLSLTGAGGSITEVVVTVIDDGGVPQPGYVKFESAAYQVHEGVGNATLNLIRFGGSLGSVEATCLTTDGTAIGPGDYAPDKYTVTFADGETSKILSIPIVNDTDSESAETFTVQILGVTGGADIIAPSSATVTITDNDPLPAPQIHFAVNQYGVREQDVVAVTLTAVRTGNPTSTVSVNYQTVNGTAVAPADYTAASGTLTFGPGELSKSFTVAVIQDGAGETDEQFTAVLSNPVGATLGANTSATVTIRDQSQPGTAGTLRFSSINYTASEALGTVQLTVVRTGGAFGPLSSSFTFENGTAIQGQDFTPVTTGLIGFSHGDTTPKTITVTIARDTVIEGHESFAVNLAGDRAVVTIADDGHTAQPGFVKLSATTFQAVESANGVATLSVTRTGGSTGQLNVTYQTANGSALAGSDYVAQPAGTFVIADGETSKTFTVPLIDDATREGDETFTVTLTGVDGGAELTSPTTATVTVVDDDPLPAPTLSFGRATYELREGEADKVYLTVARAGVTTATATVQYATVNGSASAPGDFQATSGTLTFNPGETTKSVAVTINTDEAFNESPESFTVTLTNPTGATVGTIGTATVTIKDFSNPSLGGDPELGADAYTANEGDGGIAVIVNRVGGAKNTLRVRYETLDGSARNGSDYTRTTGTITWLNRDNAPKSFVIPVKRDTLVEGNETFTVRLINPADNALMDQATVTIADGVISSTNGVIQFGDPTYEVAENGIKATLLVTRVAGTIGAVTVNHRTIDGTALAGTDYTAASGQLQFAEGESEKSLDVLVTDNTTYQGSRNFLVILETPTGGATLGSPVSAQVTITDDEPPPPGKLQFGQASYSVNEGVNGLTVTVTRTEGTGGEVSVTYETIADTATANSDYVPVTGSLTFADGVASKTFTVQILNDAVAEVAEKFKLKLSNPTGGATLGTPSQVDATILDDDNTNGVLAFSMSPVTVNESDGNAVLTVTRTSGTTGAVSVAYATVNGTARSGLDYTAPAPGARLSFADGESSKTITIPILDDAISEGTEGFLVVLSDPQNARLGDLTTAEVFINDDETPPANQVTFAFSNPTINEQQDSLSVTITRTGSGASSVLIDVATEPTEPASATPDVDYSTTVETVVFGVGEIAKTITVPILNDQETEPDETFRVVLRNPQNGATVGSPSAITATIRDNDLVSGVAQFNAQDYPVGEAAPTVLVTVTRSSTAGPLTLRYETSDGTARAGVNYRAKSDVLFFAAGESSKTFTVEILNNALADCDPVFNLRLTDENGLPLSTATVTILDDDTILDGRLFKRLDPLGGRFASLFLEPATLPSPALRDGPRRRTFEGAF